jgi:RNA polymerase sigma-70 factor, ECF subfamily
LSNSLAPYVFIHMRGSQLGRGQELSRALYEEHATALMAYVQHLLHGDRQLAEDIVQETMIRAWRSAGQVPPRARRPWLFSTAHHLVIDAYRARKSRPTEVSPELMDVAVEEDGLDVALDTMLLTDALRALSAEHRAVLFDVYYRGQTAAQIASARRLPPGTVRSRIHYALRALRLALQERGVNGL